MGRMGKGKGRGRYVWGKREVWGRGRYRGEEGDGEGKGEVRVGGKGKGEVWGGEGTCWRRGTCGESRYTREREIREVWSMTEGKRSY